MYSKLFGPVFEPPSQTANFMGCYSQVAFRGEKERSLVNGVYKFFRLNMQPGKTSKLHKSGLSQVWERKTVANI